MKPRLCLLKPTFELEQYPRVNPELPELEVITNQWAIATPGDEYFWLRKNWTPEDQALGNTNPLIAVLSPAPPRSWTGQEVEVPSYSAGLQPSSARSHISDLYFAKNLFHFPQDLLEVPKLMGWTRRTRVRPQEIREAKNSYEYYYEFWRATKTISFLKWEAVVPTRGQVRDYYSKQFGGELALKIMGCDPSATIAVEYPNNCLTARELCGWFMEGAGYPFLRDRHGAIVESDLDKAIAAVGDAPLNKALDILEDLQPTEAF